LFIEQIASGKPITITDPRMTRFMMSIEDAVDLVVYAFKNAQPGDLFVHKAPAATIEDVATAMKTIFGALSPIQLIGIRHGEKLWETLLTREEMLCAEDRGGYFRVLADARDLNYTIFTTEGIGDGPIEVSDYNSHTTRRLSIEETISLLTTLPEVQDALKKVVAHR
ncbi:MAG: UDP-glucose 4-epimerase, partial [Verrucomicrobiaceae bacterium]